VIRVVYVDSVNYDGSIVVMEISGSLVYSWRAGASRSDAHRNSIAIRSEVLRSRVCCCSICCRECRSNRVLLQL